MVVELGCLVDLLKIGYRGEDVFEVGSEILHHDFNQIDRDSTCDDQVIFVIQTLQY